MSTGLHGKRPRLVTRKASEVEARAVEWLWPGRIPLGMLAELNGDPGMGKSTITADLAARVSRGWPFPGDGGTTRRPAAVLYLNAEDSAEHATRPRLEAAGADLDLVHILDCVAADARGETAEGPLVLPDHFDLLRAKIVETAAALVILDPLNAFLSDGVDGHKDQSVRSQLMYPLKKLADQTGATMLLVRHLNKLAAGKAIYRAGGSVGFSGAVRASLAVGPHPDDDSRQVLASVKASLGPKPPALVYSIGSAGAASRISWHGETNVSADDILAPPSDNKGERRQPRRATAAEYIRGLLAGGPKPAGECEALARKEGFSEATVNRAKKLLGVKSEKSGMGGGWVWSLPGGDGFDEGDHTEGDQPSSIDDPLIPFGENTEEHREFPEGDQSAGPPPELIPFGGVADVAAATLGQGAGCPDCRRPLRKGACWTCDTSFCPGCGRRTGSPLISYWNTCPVPAAAG